MFTNPELRADGLTPLGKSLFYAGEYLRKYVVIDGKPCEVDSDCNSPGYYCSAASKRCQDPLKDCRLNMIVLFTDGGETEFPFTGEFFNPSVQAKRLRYGLGCESDEDCSDLPFCRPKRNGKSCNGTTPCTSPDYECNLAVELCEHKDPAETECFNVFCKPDPQGNYCTHEILEQEGKPIIKLNDETASPSNRLEDYNGNSINAVVNVIDASIADPEAVEETLSNNFQIALHGGGLHVVVAVQDSEEFLLKLKATVDAKSLFTKCRIDGQ